jgi:hypothetical protein
MPTVQSKLSSQLTDVFGAQWRRWTLVSAALVGTVLIGRYVAQKYYVESISKVLKDENDRHELARLDKNGRPIDTIEEEAEDAEEVRRPSESSKVDESGNTQNAPKVSRSEPPTPSNQPSGLAMLSDTYRPTLRGSSLCDLSGGIARMPPRRRAAPSLASTQINMSLQSPEELIMFGNEYVKRALKIWDDTRTRIQGEIQVEGRPSSILLT